MFKKLIDELGGPKQLASALGASHGAVRNWVLDDRGIPWKYRPAVAKLAAERAVDLPDGFWTVPTKRQAAA